MTLKFFFFLTELQGRNTSFTDGDRERPYLTAHVVFPEESPSASLAICTENYIPLVPFTSHKRDPYLGPDGVSPAAYCEFLKMG